MSEGTKNRNIRQYFDALLDEDGIKSDVSITVTTETAWKIVGVGVGLLILYRLIANVIPRREQVLGNRLLAENNRLLKQTLDAS